MRLQKFMAQCGVASRRKSEILIQNSLVKVNGEIITELGHKIDINKDTVIVDGKIIKLEEKKVYILLNKPEGYITTASDQFNRPTVLDLVKNVEERIYPVGRLDFDTSGLLILTNDGELTYKLTHPRHEITKTYIAKIEGIPTIEQISAFENGLKINNYITSKAVFKIIRKDNRFSIVEIKIHEGKNRQVRKMCSKIGHPVIKLKRISIGEIKLDNSMKKGTFKYLTQKEINYLKTI